MKHCKYLIVGGGMTADSAIHGIRKVDQNGVIDMVCEEPHPPYDRPPLSKSLWKESPLESIWRSSNDDPNFSMHLGRQVVALDPAQKTATDDGGTVYTYEKLLLATGGSTRRLPAADGHIIYFRTVDDYRKLRELCKDGTDFVIIGGGFIGSEVAAALAMNNKRVTMIFPEKSIGARVYPPALSEFLNNHYREKGVSVHASQTVKSIRTTNTKTIVTTENGSEIFTDGVVAGLGIQPNTDLAKQAGLTVDNGIVIDEMLRTSNLDIYAAGDVANFYSVLLEKRMRVEHEDNANIMGEMAGRNMAGQSNSYQHQPFFYSDLFDLGYEAVGELNASLDTIEDWKEPFRKGVIYYLQNRRVCGVLLWNTWGQVDVATQLIAEKVEHTRATLQGRISD